MEEGKIFDEDETACILKRLLYLNGEWLMKMKHQKLTPCLEVDKFMMKMKQLVLTPLPGS